MGVNGQRSIEFADVPPLYFGHYLIFYSSSPFMFFIIGLGLSDEKDITIRGLEVTSPRHYKF